MSKNNREGVFERCGAVLKGHFVLAFMEHSDTYLEKASLYRNPVIFEELCLQMAREVASKSINIDVVAGPAPIGAVLAQRVAYHLGGIYRKVVVPLFTEKDKTGHHVLRRNFAKYFAGKDVLVVDDIMISGKSARQLIKAATLAQGRVVAVAVICNRGDIGPENLYGFPVTSLLKMKLKAWLEGVCPLCRARVPISADIGRGREFLESHPGYPVK